MSGSDSSELAGLDEVDAVKTAIADVKLDEAARLLKHVPINHPR